MRRRGLTYDVPREKREAMFTDDIVLALLAVGRQVAVGEAVAGQALVARDPVRSKIVRGRRGSLPMWTSLGAKRVAVLTDLLHINLT